MLYEPTKLAPCTCGAFRPGADVQCIRCGGWGHMTAWSEAPPATDVAKFEHYADLLERHGITVVRPPGFWPWAVDQLLDAKQAIRRRARRLERPLADFAHRQIERHGVSCAGCGLGNAFKPHPCYDAASCSACGRTVTGLRWALLPGRPIRTWLFGA